jgi:membrane-associated protease RseP (regulator of RpoE activity)
MGAASRAPQLSWRTNAWLFVATVASTSLTWLEQEAPTRSGLAHALQYTCALMTILLAHEFGHYIAARIHKVDASLPYFIPMPVISPFGTMGAVIRMRSVIPTRRALLDIGAAGPLAGLVFAIPLYAWGIAHSRVVAIDSTDGDIQLGSSLLARLLEHFFAPNIPDGMDIVLSPVAFAAWVGMFVTMINLLPIGQLDGGHVAFSLFGPRQNTIARWVHRSMLVFFFVGLASLAARDVRAGFGLWRIGRHVYNSLFWFTLFEVLAVLGSLSTPARQRHEDETSEERPWLDNRTRVFATIGLALLAWAFRDKTSPFLWGAWFLGLGVLLAMEARWGALRNTSALLDHPATGPHPLSFGRAAIAVLTLAFFALLFMPVPIAL